MYKPWDPHGIVVTYGDYQKTTVPKSVGQGMAFTAYFCGLDWNFSVKTYPNRKNKATFDT